MLNLVHRVAGRPWAIQAEIALHIRGLIAKDGIGGLRHLAELKDTIHAAELEARKGSARALAGQVAVIPVVGVLTQRGDVINSEATRSTAELVDQVLAAVAEPRIDAVVLEFDTPGGEVFGVPEAWTAIRAAAKVKPIIGHANAVAASAGYYLLCACSEAWVTPSGQVGSVGVYALHVDASRAIADMGEKWTFISAGKYKVEGNPAEPLSEEARKAFQAEVDRYYEMFTRDVAKGRAVTQHRVQNGFGEGRMVGAAAAVEEKMADRVGTLDQAIARAAELASEARRAARGQEAHGQAFTLSPATWGTHVAEALGDRFGTVEAEKEPSEAQRQALARARTL